MEIVLNQLIYFGFLQSIFLLGIYFFSPKKKINGYLIFLVLVLVLGLSGRILNMTEIFGRNFRFITISEFSNLLFGPTVYLFTQSSLLNQSFSRKKLIHYVPAIIYSIGVIIVFIVPSDQVIRARFQSGALFWHIILFIGYALLFNISYWIASLRIFLGFRKKLESELSYVVKAHFFQIFLFSIGLCLLLWLTFYIISLFGFDLIEREARNYIWTSIALIMLLIAYYTIKEPELFTIAPKIISKKYAFSKLSIKELGELKDQLTQLMESKKPYLNSNLMKADLAEMLGVNHPEVARLLNESIGMNFFEYVNYYRIKEFIALAKTDRAKQLTFFGLAQEAGFNSKTTFNKAFKKLMGTSPSNYLSKN